MGKKGAIQMKRMDKKEVAEYLDSYNLGKIKLESKKSNIVFFIFGVICRDDAD